MLTKIKDRIAAHGFSDYLISRVISHECQLYLIKKGVESARDVESRYYCVTVYLDQDFDGRLTRGDYTFFIKSGEDLDRCLDEARVGATLVRNRTYRLMPPSPYPPVDLYDRRLGDVREQARRLAETIIRSSAEGPVFLSSAELFLTRSEIEFHSSTGIVAAKEKGRIEVDFTLASESDGRMAEVHHNIVRRNFDHLALEKLLADHRRYAWDMLDVRLPGTGLATVVFDHTNIRNFLYPLIFHSAAKVKDLGINKYEIGKPVCPANADGSFTLISSGLIPYGLYSDPFDEEGIPGQEHMVIDRGTLVRFLANKQYADYLGLEPTGVFKNMIIRPAARDLPSTIADDHYQIVKFSDFSPDPITGDFVAEIRFGYHCHNGERIPIKGGSISGNVFQCLPNLTFGPGTVFGGDYSGPDMAAVSKVNVAGG